MTVGKIIVNSTLALSIAASIVMALAGIVYADREKQLAEAKLIAEQFHTHEVKQGQIEAELVTHQTANENRIDKLENKIDQANAKLDRIMERFIK